VLIRGILGFLLCLVGLLWIGQGVGVIGYSMMSGHAQYAVLGAVVLVIGLILLWWSRRTRKRRTR
jgi:membrane protein DedA with SNARE-associated domain